MASVSKWLGYPKSWWLSLSPRRFRTLTQLLRDHLGSALPCESYSLSTDYGYLLVFTWRHPSMLESAHVFYNLACSQCLWIQVGHMVSYHPSQLLVSDSSMWTWGSEESVSLWSQRKTLLGYSYTMEWNWVQWEDYGSRSLYLDLGGRRHQSHCDSAYLWSDHDLLIQW